MKVAVVGTGLIGTSIALGAVHRGHQVFLRDDHAPHLAQAVQLGAGTPWQDEDVDLVVVAVPPADLGPVVIHTLRTNPQSTVMDVGSIKANLLREVEALGLDVERFVPTHPMAGRETSGPGAARADLFADRIWVLCPGADPARVVLVASLIADLGATAVTMTAQDHDHAVATTSHAAQLVSSALAAQLGDLAPDSVAISGQGLRDVTRLAGSDPGLWEQILSANAGQVAAVVARLGADLAAVAEELRASSADGQSDLSITRQLLERGRAGRDLIPGRHGSGSENMATVAVQVADEPGSLAKLFVAAGDLGINLLDVRIDHLWGRPSGLIELSVDPHEVASLRSGLLAQGFDVRA